MEAFHVAENTVCLRHKTSNSSALHGVANWVKQCGAPFAQAFLTNAGPGFTKWSWDISLDFAILGWLHEATRDRTYDFHAPGVNAKRTAGPLAIQNASAPVGLPVLP